MAWPSEDFCERSDVHHERSQAAKVVKYFVVSVFTWESVDPNELAKQIDMAISTSGAVRLGTVTKVLPITAWTV